MEALRYGLDTLHEDVADCLEDWKSQSATASGSLRLGFRLDPSGVTEAWVVDGERVPFGPRTCVANAVYGLDWANIVDHPAEVTDDFRLDGQGQ